MSFWPWESSGARELNYSSDIDLIVLFDPEKANYRGRRSPQEAFVRLTRDLVTLLDERTGDGYVLRTDLRLRPDPGAMPMAITYNAAMAYYESMGQNWERAAMIKARPAAGDLDLGRAFLRELTPFVWRKHLDFWAIQDVHSIKRQIHAQKGGAQIALAGHNIKLGRGGIREIEFFAQTQQLIYGGRSPALRTPRTKQALAALVEAGRIDQSTASTLSQAYDQLRRLEHRLQMVDDQQTHSLPTAPEDLETIAAFFGCPDLDSFRDQLFADLRRVETAYAALFEEAPTLAPTGALVFTGAEPGDETLETLRQLGFTDGAKVFHLVRTWHHGRYRATRSTRARELLTEMMPTLLGALGKTQAPDTAVAKFDEFLSGLPAGVQLFSLLYANPWLLDFLAEMMGGAPALADALSRKPDLLDAVLSFGFFDPMPEKATLSAELKSTLDHARDYQDVLDLTRRWTNDHRFQAGAHILRGTVEVEDSGRALSDLADVAIDRLERSVLDELSRTHGRIPGPGMAVLALGKLGGREMTLTSDLDLIFVYQIDEACEASDGPKPLAPSQYFGRLAQRLINALSAPTAEGRLYEIDMRLRPSGSSGPIAVSLSAFERYQLSEAWTWEHMALTRARMVAGNIGVSTRIASIVLDALTTPRSPDRLLLDVHQMRERIADSHKPYSLWNVKYLRGGLVDLDFIAQYLMLRHAHDHPKVLAPSTQEAFPRLADEGLLGRELAADLTATTRLMRQIQSYLRVTTTDRFDEEQAPDSTKVVLAEATGSANFAALKDRLILSAQRASDAYNELIAEPARDVAAGNTDS